MKLNVLYACDNNYAPYAGVSICSLLENNKEIGIINIYLITDNVLEENIQKLQKQVNKYGKGRMLKVVDAEHHVTYLKGTKTNKYRGGYAAYLRIFFDEYIDEDVDRLLYLDCDTLVVGDLQPLLYLEMDDNCVADVQESLAGRYKKNIDFTAQTPYFNSGVLLYNVKAWADKNCKEKLLDNMENGTKRFVNPDQDHLNILLKEDMVILPPDYNLQPFHLAYSDKTYFSFYSSECYYSVDELEKARKNPIILHAYRFLGQFPWHKNSLHPCKAIYDEYLQKSEWVGFKDLENRKGLYALERLAYRILPKKLFLFIYEKLQRLYFRCKIIMLRNKSAG